MAEVQKNTESGETTQIFIQFVMMQQQQALLAMGKHPSRPPGAPPSNLALAKIFIDQMTMIQTKTAGNLSQEEGRILEAALSTLQAVYVETLQEQRSGPEASKNLPEATSGV
jgi:Domain of unknown function (DUF1844)